MRKDYSDLSDKQKVLYIKRAVVAGIIAVIPLAVMFGIFSVLAVNLTSNYDEISPETFELIINATSLEDATKYSEAHTQSIEAMTYLVVFMILSAIMGWVVISMDVAIWVADSLGYVTDLNLESAERRVAKIKEALEK